MAKNVLLLLLFCCLPIAAQDKITDELKNLVNEKQYAKIINEYAPKSDDYSARALYYVGYAYYMSEDDVTSIKYMDKSINKDKTFASAYYIRGCNYYFTGRYNEAVTDLEKAVSMKKDDADLYSRLGDAHDKLGHNEQALEAYKSAVNQPNVTTRYIVQLGNLYNENGKDKEALENYYRAKKLLTAEDKLYANVLFNIGLIESLSGNYDKAEPVFKELIVASPQDYHAYSKLIQIYYHQKEYYKAKPYKDILYDAYAKGLLKDNLKDMFCFDQFIVNGHRVQVFERFESGKKSNIYNKQIFYVLDDKGEILFTVQTEYSPIAVQLGESTYMLCAQVGSTHYNSGLGFNDDFDYTVLKEQANKMITAHLK